MLQPRRYPRPQPPRRPPPRATARMPFDCTRCLLHLDFETDGTTRPEGWQVVERPGARRLGGKLHLDDLVWRCASCVREVAAGSPEELGR